MKLTVQVFLGATAVVFGAAASSQANSITLDQTIFDTNYTASDLGMRDVGAGNIVVSGVGGPVTNALLFWHGPTNSNSPTANANVSVAGTPVTGTNIGFSQDNFWASLNSQAYRADVTSLITGDGSYALSGFQNASAQINGAGLFTFYDSGVSTGRRDVVIFDGNDSNFASSFDPAGWDFTLSGINYTSGQAFLQLLVSDGQNFSPNDDGTLRVNGTAIATGGIFQGLGPRAPGAGVSNGSLIDLERFDITSLLSPGVNSLHITLDAGFDDALSAVVAVVDLPAGAAPNQPGGEVPEPATLLLLGSGLAYGLRRRRQKS